jgi:hypothetical protein
LTRWLLNTFPAWALALLGVLCSGSLAVAGLLLFRKRFPKLAGASGLNEAAGITIGVLAAIYGITLGFVIVTLYENFESAQSAVQDSASQLVQLYRDTSGLPIAKAIRGEMTTYVANVRFREFPLMREGKSFDQVGDLHITHMYEILQDYQPRTPAQVAFYGDAIGRLDDVVAARMHRLFASGQELPLPFDILLFVGAALLVGSLYLLNVDSRRVHLTLVLGVTLILSLSLTLAIELDNPFAGSVSVSSQPYSQDVLASLHATPAEADGR